MIIERLARNPLLWRVFETFFGADEQKKQVYRSAFENKYKLLDFGCSIGNTTGAFLDFDYTGIDIDAYAINYAKRRWGKYKNVKFICDDIFNRPIRSKSFDYILFAGTGHHLSTEVFLPITRELIRLLKKGGEIWFYDILKPGKHSHLLTRFLASIDRGKNIRTYPMYKKLFSQMKEIKVLESKVIKIQGTLIPQEDYCFFKIIGR